MVASRVVGEVLLSMDGSIDAGLVADSELGPGYEASLIGCHPMDHRDRLVVWASDSHNGGTTDTD